MITRFAPSPTGPLHLGHAYSAMLAHDLAHTSGGQFLLRIEDLDRERCKPEWEALIEQDLSWLGLDWPRPVRRQSDHPQDHAGALDWLSALGLVYPCRCNRADIRAALSAPQEGAPTPLGPDGLVYPGTCRARTMSDRQPGDALRLNMARAVARTGPITFTEIGPERAGTHRVAPETLVNEIGDVVLARRGSGAIAYHLAVTVDDAVQQISHVVRSVDLFEATAIHVLLQRLLELPTPLYHHHRLIRDETGKRLAKRDDARAIRLYREAGKIPADIRAMVSLPPAP
ncbi:MAG: tRNA glutamyl-Q(34) synthetase GluQRS [Rhodobacteraceae bacterium]|nr:tRNA glutamyl-Q(34) synthetase GluQRS [Paracoccaceae bacterium]